MLTGLFIVSLVSGIALFFHWGQGLFHGMHEWLSMVLIAPFVLHVWKNWKPFLAYFRRTPMAVALAVSVIAAVPFAWPTSGDAPSGNPMVMVLRSVQSSPLEAVAPVFGHTRETLVAALEQNGYSVPLDALNLQQVAAANGKSDRDIAGVLAHLKD
ncbi:DUF4405 domain-containing protein [Breoghania sp. L-A4]|uniref:DUF4405 domain-containing protein n=1 Tax=Breoghania sp. L-A4 TaxID=2304600 RepID=UPI0020C05AAB|nr:DUF4405 domain-containing protein [Breoghania sp. L-A4]